MKFLPLLTIAFFLVSNNGLLGQSDRDRFIQSVGLDSLSDAGKDSLFFYTSKDMSNTFWLPIQTRNAKSIPETSDVFYNMFKSRMTESDLNIVLNYWSAKQAEYVEQIKGYESTYVKALDCQKRTIDSLLGIYLTPLQASVIDLDSAITDIQIAELSNYYKKRLPSYASKKREFLKYHQRFTVPITNALLDYMEYGFKVMDAIPVSYYLDLTSPNKKKLPFIEPLSDNPYVELFRAFETQLDTLLTYENECRGHQAIPFYHEEIRDKNYHTTLNALLFAHKKGWLREVVIPKQEIDWPDLVSYQLQDTINLKENIDFDLARELGLSYVEEGENLGGVWFNDARSGLKNVMMTLCSVATENSDIESFVDKYKFDNISVIKETGVQFFYVLDEEETGLSIMEGILFTKNKVLCIVYSSPAFDLETMKRELSIVK